MARPRTPEGPGPRDGASRLAEEYPDGRELCELDHRNPFELLAATILSAQTTDVRVNMVTPALFARYPTPRTWPPPTRASVEEIIRSTGFYQNKTRSLIGMAQALVERFDGEVPTALEDLVTLPGVGRKTANVVRSVAFDLPGLPVDTHVDPAVAAARADRRDRPGQDRARAQRHGAGRGAGRLQPAADPARPPGVRRPQPALRPMCVLADICPSSALPAQTRRRVSVADATLRATQ